MFLRLLLPALLALIILALSCDKRVVQTQDPEQAKSERAKSDGPGDPDPRVLALHQAAKSLDSAQTIKSFLSNAPQKRLFLLGESTHGTSEFYTIRAELSQALIEADHANFVGVEGDWGAIAALNDYVQHRTNTSATEIAMAFDRWPRWMWANAEFIRFVEWLRDFNTDRAAAQRIGLYGIDVYGPDRSIPKLSQHLNETGRANLALEKLRCIRPYAREFRKYAQHLRRGGESCHEPLMKLTTLLAEDYDTEPSAETFAAVQKAHVVKAAEQHYRAMAGMDEESSWNRRVDHFADTIDRLLKFYDSKLGGAQSSKGIIWAHNTHIGDARATTMAARGDRNIGQLTRERHGKSNVKIVGFASHRGSLLAGQKWGHPVEVMEMPEAQGDSLSDLAKRTDLSRFMVRLEEVATHFSEELGHRAIGVTYSPASDHRNYVPTRVAERYTWLIFVEETTSLNALH